MKYTLKKRIERVCAFIVIACFCAAFVIMQVLFLYNITTHGLSAVVAYQETLERNLRVFPVDPVSLRVFLEQAIYLQEDLA
ncbi:hypothetical protein [Sphingobacterium sp. JB170]|uniref:hypothetical protein n=1 Tax=Sphingobacterium sp. JB170 TaxID=1434842 RepID=UPI000B34B418|nr:hypothetical protein [Sphingobacterium sp. JB170]